MRATRVLAAGCALVLAGGCGFAVADFSPDGKTLAVTGDTALRIIDLQGGASRRVAGKTWVASFSPDGGSLLFQADAQGANAGVQVFDVTSGRTRALRGAPPGPWAWREDGKRIVGVTEEDDGAHQAVWFNVTDPGVVLRTRLPGRLAAPPVWLPDTDNAAFVLQTGTASSGKPPATDVYLAEEGEVRRITNTHDVVGLGLSADRRKLLWVRRGPNLRYILLSIYAFDLGARSVARLPFPERVRPINPDPRTAPTEVQYASLSPDGRRLALVVTEGGKAAGAPASSAARPRTVACYVMGADGSQARLLRRSPSPAGNEAVLAPFWSRDASQIAVSELPAGGKPAVWLYNSDGSSPRRIAEE